MTHYKISREELEAFSKKVYEEACYGYLDLKDSVCDGMLRDFLDGRKILSPIDTNTIERRLLDGSPPIPSPVVTTTGYMGHGHVYAGTEGTFSGVYAGTEGTFSGGTVSITVPDEPIQWEIGTDSINDIPVNNIPMSAATGLDSPLPAATYENEGIRLRGSSGHHIELVDHDDVRLEPNFQGNESERF